jgi:hypothetical protein
MAQETTIVTISMNSTPSSSQKPNPSVDGAWLAVGIGVGTALGVAFDNIAVGISLGVAFGLLLPMLKPKKKEEDKAKHDEIAGPK